LLLLHTSDWHLGKHLHGVSLLDDQAYALEHFLEIVREVRPDLVIIVGDVFDRINPPEEALDLLNSTLQKLVGELKVKTVVLPGNHDSSRRLTFGSWLHDKQGLHIVGTLDAALSPIPFEDADGPIHLHAIPYLDPFVISSYFRTQKIETHGGAGTALLEHLTRFRRLRKKAVRGLVAAYLQLEGVHAEGSERLLHGELEEGVKPAAFESLSYAALGFLHQAQSFGQNNELCYSGSLTSLDFVEHDQKSVQKVEIDGNGVAKIERIPLRSRRRLRKFVGDWNHLLLGPPEPLAPLDLCCLELTGSSIPLGGAQVEKLRKRYPNLVRLEKVNLVQDAPLSIGASDNLKQFQEFYQTVVGEPLDSKLLKTLKAEMESADQPRISSQPEEITLEVELVPAPVVVKKPAAPIAPVDQAVALEEPSSLQSAELELPDLQIDELALSDDVDELIASFNQSELNLGIDFDEELEPDITSDFSVLSDEFDAELSSIDQQLKDVEKLLESPNPSLESLS
jgi:DNA repair protein SbcD/Mre11